MSTTIDNRVVEMQFDNRNFERNVQTSMSTLEKLKQSLNLTGAAKGLTEIDAASKRMNFAGLGSAVDTVQAKFSALQIMGVTALANITNSAVNAGKRIASALTIDPIKTGFQEYETQINAVQTILANTESKGTTLQDVNRALDELNTYADKTIYNFTQMTKNIGTFTAAGVDLDTSVKSIQGIANLAAVSGSTSQQASTAMYQLSQALAAGRVSLMDWNSVVNAGMGGQVFQDALKRTAKAMGTDVDAIIKKYGSFRESLTQGEWLTTDVLTKTLEQFTMAAEEGSDAWNTYKKSLMDDGYTEKQAIEILKMANTATDAATKVKTFTQLWDTLKESAQSGWTQTWEIIMGDFGEAKEFLTKISETIGGMIGKSAEDRNALLSGGLSTGWKQLLNAGIADEAGYTDTLKTVAKEHGVSIDDMIKKEKELDNSLSDNEAFQKVLKKGLADGTLNSDMLTESVDKLATKMSKMSAKEREAAGYTVEHVEQIKKLNESLKKGEISMDEFVKKIVRPSGRENLIESLWNAFEGLMSVVKPIKEAFREIFPPMTSEQLYKMTENLKEFTSKLKLSGENSKKLRTTFEGIFSVLDIGWTFIKELGGGIVDLIGNFTGLGGGVLDITSSIGDYLINLRTSVKEGNLFGRAVNKIVNILEKGINTIKDFGKSLKDSFQSDKYEGFTGFLKGVWEFVSQIGSGLVKAFSGIGKAIANIFGENSFGDVLESGGLAVLGVCLYKLIDNLNGPFESLSDMFDNLFGEGGMFEEGGILTNIRGVLDDVRGCFEAYQQNLQADTLMKIAKAIGLLTAAIFVISTINPEKLGSSLEAITVLFIELVGAMAIFSKFGADIKGVAKAVPLMLGMSTALLILSGALKIIGSMDPDELFKGLVGVGVGLGMLVGALHLMPEKSVSKAAKAIRTLSISLVILGGALKIIGSMSWEELGKGLAGVAGGLIAIVAAVNLLPKDTAIRSLGMVGLATSLVILGGALKIMGSMNWSQVGRGLAALAGSLVAITISLRLMPKNMVTMGLGLIGVATALTILSSALKNMGSMSWSEIGKGLTTLGVALLELSIGLLAMRNSLSGSAALLVASAALAIFVPVLKSLGSMSWASIAKGLITIAGALTIFGIAGAVLGPMVPTLLGLAGAFALFGISVAAIGAGLTLIGIGIGTIATALTAGATSIVASLTVIITGILDLVPTIISKFGEAIVDFCKVIGDSAPQIADSLLKLISEVLKSAAKYIPVIADSLFELLIGVLDVLSARMPELVVSAVKVIGSFFEGVVDALKSVDTGSLLQGVIAVGLLAGLMYALSGVAALVPGALAGVLGIGLVIAKLALVLAAIGALAQIPGLEWLISEGGDFLQKIGTAIGQFIGGIVGGIAQGATSTLPEVGTNLANFMTNVKPFIDGAKTIDPAIMDGVKALVGAMLMLTGADIINSIASIVTGGNSLADFGAQLVPFGESMKQYGAAVAGVDTNAIMASATAAKALATVADAIPKSGGLAGLFAGENDLTSFASQLVPFGTALKGYSMAVAGIDAAAITASATAAKALAEMANIVPNEGGMVAWFTGDNSLANFGSELISLGMGLKGFAIATTGIIPESIIGAANAARALAEMMSVIPNEGGLIAWLTGENSVSRFGNDLLSLGIGLKGFAIATTGIIPESIIAAANAAKALASMMNTIPNEGGLVAWLTGENSVSSFASKLVDLGYGLQGFSLATVGIVPENIIAAANAAKSIADMANVIPNEGGIAAWFTGENSIATFATRLPALGAGLLAFSTSVAGIVPENIIAAANAGKSIAQMVAVIPNEGGIAAWFTGETSIANFADKLPALGKGLKGFSDAIEGLNPENVTAAANAAKALAQMANVIPKEGGIKAWFTGETAISNFADKLPALGKGLKGFSDSVEGINTENITAASKAAKTLAQMADTAPKDSSKMVSFGENIVKFGGKMKSYFEKTSDISEGAISNSKKAIDAVKSVGTGINSSAISSASKAIDELVKSLKGMAGITEQTTAGFSAALKKLANTSVQSIVKEFDGAGPKLAKSGKDMMQKFVEGVESQNGKINKAGQTAIKKFAEGIKSQQSSVTNACKILVTKCATALTNSSSKFRKAGEYVAKGFAAGISANTYLATAKAKAMANAAAKAAKKALDEHSPSRVFYEIGDYAGLGFINALSDNIKTAYRAGSEMAGSARDGLGNAISKVNDMFNNDIDTQPTIRPVLDLSDVRSGVGALSGMFDTTANVGVISSMMNNRNQNGTNADIISELSKLRGALGNMNNGNTYQINGITYNDDSPIADAMKAIVRATIIEGRA